MKFAILLFPSAFFIVVRQECENWQKEVHRIVIFRTIEDFFTSPNFCPIFGQVCVPKGFNGIYLTAECPFFNKTALCLSCLSLHWARYEAKIRGAVYAGAFAILQSGIPDGEFKSFLRSRPDLAKPGKQWTGEKFTCNALGQLMNVWPIRPGIWSILLFFMVYTYEDLSFSIVSD